MNEAILILPNMRGACTTVHTLFRVSGRRHLPMARPADKPETRQEPGDASGD